MKKLYLIAFLLLFSNTVYPSSFHTEEVSGKTGFWPKTPPRTGAKLTEGLLAHYKMNDLSGTTIVDATGRHKGESVSDSSVLVTAGKINHALTFDSFVNKIGCQSDFIETSPLTICAWIYPQGWGEGGGGRIVTNGKTSFMVDNIVQGPKFLSDGSTSASAAGSSLTLNTWQHVAVTRTYAGVANFYIDGERNGTYDQSSGTPVAGTTNVTIGNNNAASRTFYGRIDDVRIYDRVLPLREIKYIYKSGEGTEW